jgi:hypothetical protein
MLGWKGKEESRLFKNSPDVQPEIGQGRQHFLSASQPKEVNEHVEVRKRKRDVDNDNESKLYQDASNTLMGSRSGTHD